MANNYSPIVAWRFDAAESDRDSNVPSERSRVSRGVRERVSEEQGELFKRVKRR
jgi:hypothetical protein